ncbi:MAG: hypothetical protein AB1762_19740 [Gemmatimonadota bacterium]
MSRPRFSAQAVCDPLLAERENAVQLTPDQRMGDLTVPQAAAVDELHTQLPPGDSSASAQGNAKHAHYIVDQCTVRIAMGIAVVRRNPKVGGVIRARFVGSEKNSKTSAIPRLTIVVVTSVWSPKLMTPGPLRCVGLSNFPAEDVDAIWTRR